MAPMRTAKNGGRPRRPNLPHLTPLAQATSMPLELPSPSPAAAAAPATATTPAAQATPGSFDTYSTWLPMLSNYSAPMVQNLDLSASSCSMQEESDMGSYPPGGFLNFMQRSSNYSLQENRHREPMSGNFVNASSRAQYAPFEAQQPQMAKAKSSHSLPEQNTPHSALGSQAAATHIVDIDNIDGNGGSPSMFTKKDTGGSRPAKRVIWTPNETMRLVSAWLKNSNDTVKGNWKRNDQYWGSVTAMFNSTTPGDRTREIKQLKEQWHRVNKSVNYFQGCWIKAERLHGSGESDEQVTDNAEAFYEEESDDGEFKLEACWKVLRDRPKWHAYNEDLNGSHKRKYSEAEAVDLTASADAVTDLQRPIGCKKAKEELNRKGKGKVSSSIMDEIDKLIEGQQKSKEDRMEILDRHQQIAADKKESARLTHLVAQENKEAKLLEKEGKKHDKESKLLETYKALLIIDTIQMHEDMRTERMLALKGMREMIFPHRASGQ